jgi:hypothetical protein
MNTTSESFKEAMKLALFGSDSDALWFAAKNHLALYYAITGSWFLSRFAYEPPVLEPVQPPTYVLNIRISDRTS